MATDFSFTEPVTVFASARDKYVVENAASNKPTAAAFQRVLFGPQIPSERELFVLPDESEELAIARRAAYCANHAILSNAADEIVGSCNADAFAQVLSVASDSTPPDGLIPTVVLYSGGNTADHEMVFPPLIRALRLR